MLFCQYGFYAASAEEPALCDNDRTCKGYFLDSSKETLRNSFISFSNSNEVLRARVPAALLLCQYLHNNKAAGLRARKVSLELEKKLKEFRKTSLAAAAK